MLTIHIRRRARTYKCYGQKSLSQLPQTLFRPQQDVFKNFCLFVYHFLFFLVHAAFTEYLIKQTTAIFFAVFFKEEPLDFNPLAYYFL